jgi:hypothetical protein
VTVCERTTWPSGSYFSCGDADDGVVSAEDWEEHAFDFFGEVVFDLLAIAHLAGGGAERGVLLEVFGEDATPLVDDGDLVRNEALHRVSDEVADGVDGVGVEATGGELDENGGGRLDVLIGQQEAVFRLHDHEAGGADALKLGDGASELALESAAVVGALHEIGEAELALVEDLEADAVAGGNALSGHLHAEAVDLIGGNVDGGAAVGDFVRNVLRLELAHDGGGVFLGETAVEELEIGTSRPHDQRDEADHDDAGGEDDRDALVEAEFLPECEEGLGEVFHLADRRSGGRKR